MTRHIPGRRALMLQAAAAAAAAAAARRGGHVYLGAAEPAKRTLWLVMDNTVAPIRLAN